MKPWCTSENSATSHTLAFMGHKKGWTKTGRGKRLSLVGVGDSFLRVMDREAVARMSGSHQMDLIN